MADALGTRTLTYNAALQPYTETIAGSLYNKILTRQYQASGTGQVPGRPAGFLLGTPADPGADPAVTYSYDTLGRFASVSDGTRTFRWRPSNSGIPVGS